MTQSTRATISIVIPVYNGAEYLAGALRCCLEQSEAPHEVIVVDDGSTDETPRMLAKFARDPLVRILTQANAGISAARNAGIAAASGSYVAFLDADDELEPDALARYMVALEVRPEADILFSDYWLSDVAGARRSIHAALGGTVGIPGLLPGQDGVGLLGEKFGKAYGEHAVSQTYVHTSAILIRRSLLESLGGFDPDLVIGEDYDLWRRCFAGGTAAVLTSGPISTYFRWRGSVEKYERACQRSIQRLEGRLQALPPFSRERRRIRFSIAKEYLILLHGLGMQRSSRRLTLPVLLRSIIAYPHGRHIRYCAMMLVPRSALAVLHRLRSRSAG
jgi:glycosyltransferase involved in cell wall biosynthesis